MSAVYICTEQETANHIKCCVFNWPGVKSTAYNCHTQECTSSTRQNSRSRRNTARRGNTRKNRGRGRKEDKENKICLIPLCRPQNYNFACGSLWVLNVVSDIKVGT
jgi:hypothetical protein